MIIVDECHRGSARDRSSWREILEYFEPAYQLGLTATPKRDDDEEYQTKDFERVVALKARTEAIARHLTDFLKKTDRFAKTIVFCVDQNHASEMCRVLNNLNADLVKQYPDYVCRVTADEGQSRSRLRW